MTIITNHLNIDRSEDPEYWYLWALDFKNTFLFLYSRVTNLYRLKNINLDKLPPQPGNLATLTIYYASIELYMKTYLLAKGILKTRQLRRKEFGHHLEVLRKVCSKSDARFNNEALKWIIKVMEMSLKSDWSQIKYPPRRAPLFKVGAERTKNSHVMPLYGKETMIPPLELLEDIVIPLVYTKD